MKPSTTSSLPATSLSFPTDLLACFTALNSFNANNTSTTNSTNILGGLPEHLKQFLPNPDPGLAPSPGAGLEETDAASSTPENSLGIGGKDEEEVTFTFNERLFRREKADQYSSELLESLVTLLNKATGFPVKIVGKEKNRRVPKCPVCDHTFNYGLPDFKRHLLTKHLNAPRDLFKELTKYLSTSKVDLPPVSPALSPSLAQEDQVKQADMRLWRAKNTSHTTKEIPLPYSIAVLEYLLKQDPDIKPEHRLDIMERMKSYCTMKAMTEVQEDGAKRHKCCQCKYESCHSLADVRKHIMGSHCGISTKHFRHCLQASRLDNTDFALLPDVRLIKMAQESRSKRHGMVLNTPGNSSFPNNAALLMENDGSEAEDSVAATQATPSPQENREPDENGVSRHTATLPGSSRSLKVLIRCPPRPSPVDTSSQLELAELIRNNPSLAGADSLVDLPLPHSKNVLKILLTNAGASPEQIEEISAKMDVYSAEKMQRVCTAGKTIAFRCSCNRLFLTTRTPDSTMRPATLADSRRHVMGVHAKISHEFTTICCQASRICRDNGFDLYDDAKLLSLANDRPIKLNPTSHSGKQSSPNPPPRTPSSRSSTSRLASLPPLLPLADLAAGSSEEDRTLNGSSRLGDADDANGGNDPLCVLSEQDPDSLERLIDLPYSASAFRTLVTEYCPDAYFDDLIKKMEIYARYKVFVQRRDNRRCFCCSGCTSSSPHGMGDIRKHILGVHAKVPERYKAAAMHCSRLSREDNTLLPDDQLLALARDKIKGSRCNASMADGYHSASRFHLNTSGSLTDFSSTKTRVVLNRYLKGREAIPYYACSACHVASEDPAAMRSHVVREHIGIPAYECPECSKFFKTPADLVAHCRSAHENCVPTIPPDALSTNFRLAMQSVSVRVYVLIISCLLVFD